ncbi:hypothetical protein MTO96_013034 [Rhipicephalus appendiculatus]
MTTPLTNHRFPFRRPNPLHISPTPVPRYRRRSTNGPGVPTLFTGAGPCAGLIDLPFFFRFFGPPSPLRNRGPRRFSHRHRSCSTPQGERGPDTNTAMPVHQRAVLGDVVEYDPSCSQFLRPRL